MFKRFIVSAISTLVISSTAMADFKESGKVHFNAEIPEVCGINVIKDGQLSFQGEEATIEGRAIIKTRHNTKNSASIQLTTESVTPGMSADKVTYSAATYNHVAVGADQVISVPVTRNDTVEVSAYYGDEKSSVLAGQAEVITNITMQCY